MNTTSQQAGASVPEKIKVAGGYQPTTATSKKYGQIFSLREGESNSSHMGALITKPVPTPERIKRAFT